MLDSKLSLGLAGSLSTSFHAACSAILGRPFSAFLVFVLAWTLALPSSARAACTAEAVLAADGSLHRSVPTSRTCFEIRVDEPGIAMVALHAAERAALELVETSTRASVLHQTSRDLVLALEPGLHRFRARSQDSRRPLGEHRILSRFVARSGLPGGPRDGSETDNELEIDPDPLRLAPALDGSETDNELEIDPDPFRTGPLPDDRSPLRSHRRAPSHDLTRLPVLLGPTLERLCAPAFPGAVAGFFACSLLPGGRLAPGSVLEGELGPGTTQGLGRTASFRLDRPAHVELRLASAGGLRVGLYDRHGQRLESASAPGVDDTQPPVAIGTLSDLRISRTLMPGTYFLRASAARGGPSVYVLALSLDP